MRAAKDNYPVSRFLDDEGAASIRSVLDGTHSLLSKTVIRHRYHDDWEAIEPCPLLVDALGIFSIATHSVQPEDLPASILKLEADFAKRDVGTGKVQMR